METGSLDSRDPFSFGFYSCGTFCQSFRRRLSRTEHKMLFNLSVIQL